MHPEDTELADIEFLREVMLAEYHARNLRWNAVQAATLGVLGLAGYGVSRGEFKLTDVSHLLTGCLAALCVAQVALWRNDRYFARFGADLRERIKRLKGRR